MMRESLLAQELNINTWLWKDPHNVSTYDVNQNCTLERNKFLFSSKKDRGALLELRLLIQDQI